MNLYLISQDINDRYDTYDSAVVAAINPSSARKISPCRWYKWLEKEKSWGFVYEDGNIQKEVNRSWVNDLSVIKVKLIGTTNLPEGVVLASFNAG